MGRRMPRLRIVLTALVLAASLLVAGPSHADPSVTFEVTGQTQRSSYTLWFLTDCQATYTTLALAQALPGDVLTARSQPITIAPGRYFVRVEGGVAAGDTYSAWNGGSLTCPGSTPIEITEATTFVPLRAGPTVTSSWSTSVQVQGLAPNLYSSTHVTVTLFGNCEVVGSNAGPVAYLGLVQVAPQIWRLQTDRTLPPGVYRVALQAGGSRMWNGKATSCETSVPVTVDGSPITLSMSDLRHVQFRVFDQFGNQAVTWQQGYNPQEHPRTRYFYDDFVHFVGSCTSMNPKDVVVKAPQAFYNDDIGGLQPYTNSAVFLPAGTPVYAAVAWSNVPGGYLWNREAPDCQNATPIVITDQPFIDLQFKTPEKADPMLRPQSVAATSLRSVRQKLVKGKNARLPMSTVQGATLRWRTVTKRVCGVKAPKVVARKKGTCRLQVQAAATGSYFSMAREYIFAIRKKPAGKR